MSFVLVHGGSFAASCWEPLIPLLNGTVRAVDLPGRGSRPADLSKVTIADFVDSVVDEIVAIDQPVVLVGHSMAGITLPGVVGRVPDLVRKVVFVSCVVPADGDCLFDTLDPAMQAVAEEANNSDEPDAGMLERELATTVFCNDMDAEQTSFTLDRMVPEATQVIHEPVSLAGLQLPVPRVFVRLLRDAIVVPSEQDKMIANMGGAETFDLDAGHMAMVSRPTELAAILNSL
jgi:pimeloyl-ACP methyl ester carboxylesterase